MILGVLGQFFMPTVKLYLEEKYHVYLIPADGKPQLPAPMVAFVATGVSCLLFFGQTLTHLSGQIHGSLAEWQTGMRNQIDFSANHYASIYKGHLSCLGAIASQSLKAYCKLMQALYSLAWFVDYLSLDLDLTHFRTQE